MNRINHQRAIYEIRIQGALDQGWKEWFDELVVTTSYSGEQPITTILGPVADQAALRGIACKLWDLNLTLLSIHRLDTMDRGGGTK